MDLIEKFFGMHLLSIYNEGKRLVEIKMLVLLVESVKLIRLIAISFLLCTFSFVLLVLGIFTLSIRSIDLYQQNGSVFLDPMIIAGLSMAVTGGLITFIAVREKTWLKICHVDKYLDHAMQVTTTHQQLSSPQKFDVELLSSLVDSIVEQKLKQKEEGGTAQSKIPT